MSLKELQRWLRKARKRYWEAVHQRHMAPPNSAERKHLVGEVERRREVKDRLIAKIKRRLQGKDKIILAIGAPHWGGSQDILEQEVVPIYSRRGIPVTSRKRAANDPLSLSNPSSDHSAANVTAGAVDAGTANNFALADDVGRALGIGPVDDYTAYYITRGGARFRVQIIAGTHGTGPHLHVGVRRA